MSSNFTLAVESILRSLDRKDGLELPPSDISLDFLNDAVVFGDNGLVSEGKIDIFPSDMFRRTLAMLDDIGPGVKLLSQAELLSTLDWKEKPKKAPATNDLVIVMKFNFKIFSKLVECLGKIFPEKSLNEIQDDPAVDALFERIFSSRGAFAKIEENGKAWSLLMLNLQSPSPETVKHEMIHYLQSEFGVGFIEKYLKMSWDKETYGLIEAANLDKVFSRSEMSPYAHNFCYALELHGVKTVAEALEIFEKFTTMREDETPEKFIERCKNLPEYAWLDESERISAHMLMLAAIHKRSLKIFKILIAKYFSKVESSNEN